RRHDGVNPGSAVSIETVIRRGWDLQFQLKLRFPPAVSVEPGARLDDPGSFTCELPRGEETSDSTAAMKTAVIGPGVSRTSPTGATP
ncbi:hypothetical protein ABTZ89_38410, partial [Saccharopolyspora sp. NPDC002686]